MSNTIPLFDKEGVNHEKRRRFMKIPSFKLMKSQFEDVLIKFLIKSPITLSKGAIFRILPHYFKSKKSIGF